MPKSLKEIIVNQAAKEPIEVSNQILMSGWGKYVNTLEHTIAEHNMGVLRGRESS